MIKQPRGRLGPVTVAALLLGTARLPAVAQEQTAGEAIDASKSTSPAAAQVSTDPATRDTKTAASTTQQILSAITRSLLGEAESSGEPIQTPARSDPSTVLRGELEGAKRSWGLLQTTGYAQSGDFTSEKAGALFDKTESFLAGKGLGESESTKADGGSCQSELERFRLACNVISAFRASQLSILNGITKLPAGEHKTNVQKAYEALECSVAEGDTAKILATQEVLSQQLKASGIDSGDIIFYGCVGLAALVALGSLGRSQS